MVLGKLPAPGRPTNLDYRRGKGLLRLQKVRVGVVQIFFHSFIISLFFFPFLWEMARYRLKYCLKEPLNPNQPTTHLQYKRAFKLKPYEILEVKVM